MKGAKIILDIAQNWLHDFVYALLLDSITVQKIIIFVFWFNVCRLVIWSVDLKYKLFDSITISRNNCYRHNFNSSYLFFVWITWKVTKSKYKFLALFKFFQLVVCFVLSCAQIWFYYFLVGNWLVFSSYLLINHCLIDYKQIKARISKRYLCNRFGDCFLLLAICFSWGLFRNFGFIYNY